MVLMLFYVVHSSLRLLLSLFDCGFACKLGKSDFQIENLHERTYQPANKRANASNTKRQYAHKISIAPNIMYTKRRGNARGDSELVI